MMKKSFLLLLCLSLILAIGAICVSATEASPTDGLITFDGYSARTHTYNGIRAQYTLDTDILTSLENSGYDVEIGMLITAGPLALDGESDYTANMTVGSSKTLDDIKSMTNAEKAAGYVFRSVFYKTDADEDGYLGSFYPSVEGKREFVYALTYSTDSSATKSNFEKSASFRVYITLTDADGAAETLYVNNESEKFGYAISMKDLADKLVASNETNLPVLQRAIAICEGKTPAEVISILGTSIDRYSIVVSSNSDADTEAGNAYDLTAARALNAYLLEEIGYELPIFIDTALGSSYIEISTSVNYESKYTYKVSSTDSVITVSAGNITAAAEGAKALAAALGKDSYEAGEAVELTGDIYDYYDYDRLYAKDNLVYQIDFFDSKASFGMLVGGTFGNANYYKSTNSAQYRFKTDSTSTNNYFDYYSAFVVSKSVDTALTGGAMEIVAPWTSATTSSAYTAANNTDTGVNYHNLQSEYYYTYGSSGAVAFPSRWGDGYLALGHHSSLTIPATIRDELVAKIVDGAVVGGDYTVQTVMSMHDTTYTNHTADANNGYAEVLTETSIDGHNVSDIMRFGTIVVRPNAATAGIIRFSKANYTSTGLGSTGTGSVSVAVNRAQTSINEYTATVAGCYRANEVTNAATLLTYDADANTTVSLGVNAAAYFADNSSTVGQYNSISTEAGKPTIVSDSNHNTFYIGLYSDCHIYAIRIYSSALSGDEILQNHFADIAKFFKLDLEGFDGLNEDTKKKAYLAVADFTLDSDKAEIQAAVDAVLENKITVICVIDGEQTEASVSLNASVIKIAPPAASEEREFVGYYTAEEGGEQVTDKDGKLAEGITLSDGDTVYARFTDKVKISYGEGYKYVLPEADFTLDTAESDNDNEIFVGYFTDDGVRVTDASGKRYSSYTLTADVTVEAKFVNKYDTLLVGYNADKATFDNTSLILDFYSATADTAAITPRYTSNYTNITKSAQDRFVGAYSNFDPFIVYSATQNSVYGATAPITVPWYATTNKHPTALGTLDATTKLLSRDDANLPTTDGQSVYLYDATAKEVLLATKAAEGVSYKTVITSAQLAEAGAASGKGVSTEGALDLSSYDYYCFGGGKILHVTTVAGDGLYTGTGAANYGFTNEFYLKYDSTLVYASNWGDGYIHTGLNAYLYLVDSITNAKLAQGYTVQFTAKRVGGGTYIEPRIGNRYYIRSTYLTKNSSYYGSFGSFYYKDCETPFTLDINNVNSYTFTFDRSDVMNTETTTSYASLGAYANTNHIVTKENVEEKGTDTNLYLCVQADVNIYMIRVYDFVLSADEVKQNNFADIAKYLSLDIDALLSADENAKSAVYAAFAGYRIDSISASDAQALLDSTLTSAGE